MISICSSSTYYKTQTGFLQQLLALAMEISNIAKYLNNYLPWHLVQIFLVPRGRILQTSIIILGHVEMSQQHLDEFRVNLVIARKRRHVDVNFYVKSTTSQSWSHGCRLFSLHVKLKNRKTHNQQPVTQRNLLVLTCKITCSVRLVTLNCMVQKSD